MSLTLIAMTGILVGFLCLVVGFFMEDAGDTHGTRPVEKPVRRKKAVTSKKKAA